ncbi:hypothetical protein SAMN05216267_104673 [Actinacidiphila rubida]|uniref:Uncharacterized protein n=1 Tax=Actinacidiphila rubida TaxID=310780 RepID=A0A1H8SZH4_9ACTN|nr:hypothetical protein [Actinacidiphila rubida]SEO83915.1 hypothetical protein SAMN05216267_104673 [Actinacidiphila rubida]
MAGRLSWLGALTSPKQDAESRARGRRHQRTRPDRAAQQWADGGYCPAGYAHTGRCRHR